VTAGKGPVWPGLYARLKSNPEDTAAYAALGATVGSWARTEFSQQADRDDVVAETCSAVVLGIGKAYGAATFEGHVRGHYFNARRRARQRVQRSTISLGEVELVDAPSDELAPDERELLERCLAELPPLQKVAVEMRYLAGASSAVIAETLRVSPATPGNSSRGAWRGCARVRSVRGLLAESRSHDRNGLHWSV
jgi:RNA polymerase sigma factor (sigma-70 family)